MGDPGVRHGTIGGCSELYHAGAPVGEKQGWGDFQFDTVIENDNECPWGDLYGEQRTRARPLRRLVKLLHMSAFHAQIRSWSVA